MYVASLSTAGTWEWATRAGGSSHDSGNALACDTGGNLYVAGYFMGSTASFGSLSLTGNGSIQDATGFVARLATSPLATIADHATQGFTLAPNPARGRVQVTGLTPGQPVQVLDAVGRVQSTIQLPADQTLPLNLPAGVYVLRSGSQARRLVVE